MIIRNKFNGYVNGNNRLYPGGGGSPTQNTTYQTNIPEYAEPYVTTMLGATEKQLYKYGPSGEIAGFQPYKAYTEYDRARGGTGETVAGFTPMQTAAMRGVQNYQLPQQTAYASQMAGGAGLGSMMAGQRYARQATNPYAMQAYMSPYMEGAVAPELREAARQSAMLGQQNQAQAVQQGAFGGSRSAIVEAERQRNLAQQQADIYGKGMQNAFQAAQQAQQFGADIGLRGYGQAGELASTLGGLGQQQYGQELGLMGKQMEVGTQQQQYEQQRLNQIIQDYATSQQYPLMQLGVLSNMLRGLPMQAATTQMYQAQPNWMSQAAGGVGTGMALYNQAKQAGFNVAEGGHITEDGVKKYAKGGITGEYAVSDIVSKLSDAQLDAQLKNPNAPPEVKEAAAKETQRRAEMRMAGGGIVAFAGGSEKAISDPESRANDPEWKKYYATQAKDEKSETAAAKDGDMEVTGGYKSEKPASEGTHKTGPLGLKQVIDEPAVNAPAKDADVADTAERLNAALAAYKNATTPSKAGIKGGADKAGAKGTRTEVNRADSKPASTEAIDKINKGILTQLKKQPVSGAVQGEDITPVETPVPSLANQGTSGLETAPKGILTGPPKAETAAPAPAKPATPADAESELAAYAAAQKDIMGRTADQQAKIAREEREKLGIVSPYASELAKAEEKKRKIEAGSKDEYMDRLAEFLMTWGSLPGPTLVAASQAGRMFVANSIADKKERKRLLDALDASMSDINKAQYLEKLGEHKDAETKIEAAGKRFFEVNEKLREGKLKREELSNATARTLATLHSEEARAAAKLQMDKALKEMEVNKRTDFMHQVEMRVNAMVAKGAPADANTVNQAMTDILELTKGTDPAMMKAYAALTSASASVAQSVAAQQNADTRGREADTQREKARVDARKQFRSDLLTTELKAENEAAITAARKKDKEAGRRLTDENSEERKVRRGIESDLLATPAYKGLLTPEDVGIAPAPAPAPKKDAAPKTETAPAKPSIADVKGAPKGSSVGNYVTGQGWEIKGSDGKLLGYSK